MYREIVGRLGGPVRTKSFCFFFRFPASIVWWLGLLFLGVAWFSGQGVLSVQYLIQTL